LFKVFIRKITESKENSGVATMKKNRSLGNSLLLLAAPLVASLNIGISSSNAATIASSGIEPSSEETMYGGNGLAIVADGHMSDRPNFSIEDLLNSTGDDIDNSRSTFGNHLKSILGDVSLGINDFFAPNVETEYTSLTPVNNWRSERANIQAIDLLDSNKDPLRVLLKSFQSVQESEREKNQFPVTSYTETESTQPIEINPSPVAEDPVVKEPAQNNTAKTPTPTSIESSEPLPSEVKLKVAQLPKSTIDKEVKSMFDPLQIIGGAVALGFVVWMLLQD
jgi:hypothetical protein